MIALSLDKIEVVRPLFADLEQFLTLNSIFAGLSPGRVYIDNAENPQVALAGYGHRLYLGGQPLGSAGMVSLARSVKEDFIPYSQSLGKYGFVLKTAPAWYDGAPDLLAEWGAISRRRSYYRQDVRQQQWEMPDIPSGFDLRPVDAALLADDTLNNLDWMTEEMVSERPSLDDFLDKSFGYCLQYENEIIGWCMSEYNTGTRCELGIAVDERFQRWGLATLLATAVIQHALAQGVYDIGWLCWRDNAASVATAKKLGFQHVCDVPTWQVFYNRIIHLGVQGNICFSAGDFEAAVNYYQQAVAEGEAPHWLLWNCASAYARLGQEKEAFAHLHLAVEAGFTDREFIAHSPHWLPWHNTKAWAVVMNRLNE